MRQSTRVFLALCVPILLASFRAEAQMRGEDSQSMTIFGQARYTDELGNPQPIRAARVFVEGASWLSSRQRVLGETQTDINGHYRISVSINQVTSMKVKLVAENFVARILDDSGRVYSITGGLEPQSIFAGSQAKVNFKATNDLSRPSHVAFEVLDAASYIAQFLNQKLREPYPPKVTIKFPADQDRFVFDQGSGVRWVEIESATGSGRFSWATIFQEYAHYVQHLYNLNEVVDYAGLGSGEGGRNYLQDRPLCEVEFWDGRDGYGLFGKERGLKLAWTEGWARFFAGMAAREMRLEETFGIPGHGVDFLMENPPDYWRLGETSVYGVAGALWDIYDSESEFRDLDVSYPAQELWKLSKQSRAHTFSDFWKAFRRLRSSEELDRIGDILTHHRFAPDLGLAPYNVGPGSTLAWSMPRDAACGLSRYSFRVLESNFASLTWASPWQAAMSFSPSDKQLERMFPSGNLHYYTISVTNVSQPETGPYIARANTTLGRPRLVSPTPVDLVVLVNVSASMKAPAYGAEPHETQIDKVRRDVQAFLDTWRAHSVSEDRIGAIMFDGDASPVWRQTELGGYAVLHPVEAAVGPIAAALDTLPLDDECTSPGGAIQAAYDFFENEAPNGREKAVVVFTDHEAQNQNPLLADGSQIMIESVGANAAGISPACAGREASRVEPITSPDVLPLLQTIVPDGQPLGQHDIPIFVFLVDDAAPNGADFSENSILLGQVSFQTNGEFQVLSDISEDRDIFLSNDFLERIGR